MTTQSTLANLRELVAAVDAAAAPLGTDAGLYEIAYAQAANACFAMIRSPEFDELVARAERCEQLERRYLAQCALMAESEAGDKDIQANIEWLTERAESAEAEVLEQARLNGMGSEREAKLMAEVATLRHQLAAAEKDAAARTRWLLDRLCKNLSFPACRELFPNWNGDYATMNEAIDAALQAGVAPRL